MNVIVFTSPTCKPCSALKEYVEMNQLNVNYLNVETEEGSQRATEMRVRSLPSTFVVDGDKVVESEVGWNGDTRAILQQYGS